MWEHFCDNNVRTFFCDNNVRTFFLKNYLIWLLIQNRGGGWVIPWKWVGAGVPTKRKIWTHNTDTKIVKKLNKTNPLGYQTLKHAHMRPIEIPGDWFNIKMSSYQYKKHHCGNHLISTIGFPILIRWHIFILNQCQIHFNSPGSWISSFVRCIEMWTRVILKIPTFHVQPVRKCIFDKFLFYFQHVINRHFGFLFMAPILCALLCERGKWIIYVPFGTWMC